MLSGDPLFDTILSMRRRIETLEDKVKELEQTIQPVFDWSDGELPLAKVLLDGVEVPSVKRCLIGENGWVQFYLVDGRLSTMFGKVEVIWGE